jgi:hypothetical protein
MQVSGVIKRPPDRLNGIENLEILPWSKSGRKILICPPSGKSLDLFYDEVTIQRKYGGSLEEAVQNWIKRTIKKIRKYTDRPIDIRYKPKDKFERRGTNTFKECVLNDVFATVTFNSIVAAESIVNGIPAFVCAENAASPMSLSDLSRINNPIYPDRGDWLNHLAYSQFTKDEMESGLTWKILNNLEIDKSEIKEKIRESKRKRRNRRKKKIKRNKKQKNKKT